MPDPDQPDAEVRGLPLDDDTDEALDDRSEIRPSSAVGKFRRTGSGAVLGAMALGLREVFEIEKEKPPIQQDASGDPHKPRHVDAHLDPDDPAGSSVTVRPWLSEQDRGPR